MSTVSTRIFPAGMTEVVRESGGAAILLATLAVEVQAKLNTPGMGRQPYEPSSLQTGQLIRSIESDVSYEGNQPVGTVKATTPYARRQEYRITRSNRNKSYLRPALKQAKI